MGPELINFCVTRKLPAATTWLVTTLVAELNSPEATCDLLYAIEASNPGRLPLLYMCLLSGSQDIVRAALSWPDVCGGGRGGCGSSSNSSQAPPLLRYDWASLHPGIGLSALQVAALADDGGRAAHLVLESVPEAGTLWFECPVAAVAQGGALAGGQLRSPAALAQELGRLELNAAAKKLYHGSGHWPQAQQAQESVVAADGKAAAGGCDDVSDGVAATGYSGPALPGRHGNGAAAAGQLPLGLLDPVTAEFRDPRLEASFCAWRLPSLVETDRQHHLTSGATLVVAQAIMWTRPMWLLWLVMWANHLYVNAYVRLTPRRVYAATRTAEAYLSRCLLYGPLIPLTGDWIARTWGPVGGRAYFMIVVTGLSESVRLSCGHLLPAGHQALLQTLHVPWILAHVVPAVCAKVEPRGAAAGALAAVSDALSRLTGVALTASDTLAGQQCFAVTSLLIALVWVILPTAVVYLLQRTLRVEWYFRTWRQQQQQYNRPSTGVLGGTAGTPGAARRLVDPHHPALPWAAGGVALLCSVGAFWAAFATIATNAAETRT